VRVATGKASRRKIAMTGKIDHRPVSAQKVDSCGHGVDTDAATARNPLRTKAKQGVESWNRNNLAHAPNLDEATENAAQWRGLKPYGQSCPLF
jgi:hypothetical protein